MRRVLSARGVRDAGCRTSCRTIPPKRTGRVARRPVSSRIVRIRSWRTSMASISAARGCSKASRISLPPDGPPRAGARWPPPHAPSRRRAARGHRRALRGRSLARYVRGIPDEPGRSALGVGLAPPGRSYAARQAAKTTLFAAGNRAGSRKKRRRRLFPMDSAKPSDPSVEPLQQAADNLPGIGAFELARLVEQRVSGVKVDFRPRQRR